MVFQNHSLLPWLTCFENVYLAVERVFKADLKKDTQGALELVGLRTPSTSIRTKSAAA